jgi:Reverse transcriptase (RNA-dependent DNA polymerase)
MMHDMIITGDDGDEIVMLKVRPGKEFEMKDLEYLRYFLRIEVARGPKRIVLSQWKYVLDLLKETHMLGCKPVSTSIDQKSKLSAAASEPVDKERYRG